MGDIPHAVNTGSDHTDSGPEKGGIGGGSSGHELHQSPSEHAFSVKGQLSHSSPQYPFASQIDMNPSSVDGRPGSYNMGHMGNSLPQAGFRPGQYPHVSPQRYNTGNSPSIMTQVPYAGNPSMPMTGQGYYVQQPHIAQYYVGQLSQGQTTSSIPPRQNMSYYSNQMIMNHPQSGYYYTPAPQYQASGHPLPNQLMGGGQYTSQTPLANDPRAAPSLGNYRGQPSYTKEGQGELSIFDASVMLRCYYQMEMRKDRMLFEDLLESLVRVVRLLT